MAALTSSVLGRTVAFRNATPMVKARHGSVTTRAAFTLPNLPFEKNALEPIISAETLDYHHGKHHQTYVTNLNNQIKGTDMENKSLEEVVHATWNSGSPTPEFNNAAQSWNHEFYWHSMTSPSSASGGPSGALKEDIEKTFGSFDAFKDEFSKAGATQFGSGWAWLAVDNGKLEVVKSLNAENPITSGKTPILVMDVWEHAYYVDYRNARPKYIESFFKVINWNKVEERYNSAKN